MKLFQWVVGITIGTSVICMTSEALASTGCDAVNAGVFNRTNYTPPGSGVLNTQTGFEIGDKINFTVSGLPGSSFQLINGDLNTALLNQPLSNTPSSLDYIVTGSNSDTTLNTYMLVQAIPYEISISATCVPKVKPGQPAGVTPGEDVVKSFLINRLNTLLLNQPSNTSLRDRSFTSMSGLGSMLFASSFPNASDGNSGVWAPPGIDQLNALSANSRGLLGGTQPIHFRLALSDIIQNLNKAHNEARLGVDTAGNRDIAGEIPARFDIWTEAYYTNFNAGSNNIDQDGHAFVSYIGADHRISDRLLIGALAQFDSTNQTSSTLVTKVDGNGWMSGPYLSAQLPQNLFFDLRAAAGRSSSNDLNIAGVTGNFNTTRWLVIGRLSGDWLNGRWRFTPMTDLAYVEEHQKSFTTSRGTTVLSQHVSLGRMTFGPEIGYSTQVGVVVLQPYGSLKGIWNFDRPDDPILNGQLTGIGSFFGPIGPSFGTFWGRLSAGVGVLMPKGSVFRIGLMYDGVGDSNYQSFTALGQLSITLG